MTLLCPACRHGIVVGPSPADRVACRGCGREFPAPGGILHLDPQGRDSDYPEPLVDLVAQVEQRHFWFAARNHAILSALRAVQQPRDGRTVLDIGCGTGFVLATLEAAGYVGCGVDMHTSALWHARGSGGISSGAPGTSCRSEMNSTSQHCATSSSMRTTT